jgi:hypothetical protein
VLAAALATLLVMAGPAVVRGLAGFGDDPGPPQLSPTALRVLAEVPGAMRSGGLVVVPAAGDPYRSWDDPLATSRLTAPTALGVVGLVEYVTLPVQGDAPVLLSAITAADRVYSDVGPLWTGCVRAPGERRCGGALLFRQEGAWFVLRSGLDQDSLVELPGMLAALDTAPADRAGVVVDSDERGVLLLDVRSRVLAEVGSEN